MEDPYDTTGELMVQLGSVAISGDDLLATLSALVELDRLVRRQIERAETTLLRGGASVTAVARARGVSHQYMSRRAARVTAA